MVRNIIINCTLLLTALAGSTIFYSCKDDVFNPEKVRATYQDKFSVKEINSVMDYSIRNFDKNSLIEKSSIELLAKVNAKLCVFDKFQVPK